MNRPMWLTRFEYPIRATLLAIAVLASIILPYWIIEGSASRTIDASTWVVHSAEVKETVYELKAALSDLESLVLSNLVDVPQQPQRRTYQETRATFEPLLRKLEDLTADNASQQSRLGALRVIVEGRIKLLDEAVSKIDSRNFDAASDQVRQAANLFGSREAAGGIIDAENVLFVERSEQLAIAKSRARWAMTVALSAQLLLLASIIFVSERQILHRQRAESRARLAVERSRLIVQSLREPIAVLDQDLHVLMTNQAFGEFYGEPAETSREVALEELGDGSWEEPELHQRLLDVGARGRELWDYELEHRSADGIERVVLVNARRMELSDDAEHGDRPGILLTVNDVTARKRYEQRIQELNEDLEKKVEKISEVNRELESFSYSVSHDLRAPLRHIAGFSDKLGTHIGSAADEKAHHYLGVISDSARRMSTLIEDLLEYSRLGRTAFRLEAVNMNALVADVIAMLQSSMEGRVIDWQIAELPGVLGDHAMLRRVWQNLISNAIKYTARRERARIEIGLAPSTATEFVFYVCDNGTGFDMAYAGKLFGVFQRLHKASEFPGTGIGLANVRRVISRHGGRTWAEAEPDKGATIFFTLPAVAGTNPSFEALHEP